MNWSAGKIGTINQRSAHANGLSTPPIGCVLHLPGLPGGGNKIYDQSPYGNIGTITGATWVRSPGGLWCLSFDGVDDYVNCGNVQIHNNTAYTIIFWLKAPAQNDKVVFAEANSGLPNPVFLITSGAAVTDMSAVRVFVRNDDGSNPINLEVITGGFDDTWHMISYVDNNGSIRVYVDLKSATASYTKVLKTLDNVHLGCYYINGAYGSYSTGIIALLRGYNRASTPLEIQNHYQQERHLFGV